MPPKKINPITLKIIQLIESGKLISIPSTKTRITKELICWLADLRYPTLENVFTRHIISKLTMKSLRFAGIISEKDESDYRKFVMENDPRRKRAKERNSIDQLQKSDETVEGHDDSECADNEGDDSVHTEPV